jgi:hypothetical protein
VNNLLKQDSIQIVRKYVIFFKDHLQLSGFQAANVPELYINENDSNSLQALSATWNLELC